MDATGVRANPELSLAQTLPQRQREVRMAQLRSIARQHPEAMVAVIQKWLGDDARNERVERLKALSRRTRLPHMERWHSQVRVVAVE